MFRELNITDIEFAGLLGLLFWNHSKFIFFFNWIKKKKNFLGNEGLLDTEIKIVEQTQTALYNELYNSCAQNVTDFIDYGTRFSKLCNVITQSYVSWIKINIFVAFLKI